MKQDLRLCYTESGWAWFTDVEDFDEIHADDWDDGYRQGGPYGSDRYDLVKVAFDGPVGDANMEVPPEMINSQELAWVESLSYAEEQVRIPAKSSLSSFVDAIQRAGGEVYLPASEVGLAELDE